MRHTTTSAMMEDDSLIIAAGLSFLTVSASEEANRSHKTNSNDNTVSTTFSVDQASGFGDNTMLDIDILYHFNQFGQGCDL